MAEPEAVAAVEPAEAVLAWTDLAAASRHEAVRSRVWLGLVPLCLVLLVAAVAVPVVVLRVMAVLLLVFVATVPLWGPTAATWVQARRRVFPSEPTRWQARPDGLAIEAPSGRSTLPWPALTRCDPWRKGVSLRYGRAVAFLPDRAFKSAGQRQAFVAAVQGFMATGRH